MAAWCGCVSLPLGPTVHVLDVTPSGADGSLHQLPPTGTRTGASTRPDSPSRTSG